MIRANVNLLDPEEVKLFIKRNKNWSDGHKVNAVYAYNDFCKMMKTLQHYAKTATILQSAEPKTVTTIRCYN